MRERHTSLPEFLNAFLPFPLSDVKEYFRLVAEILPSPTQKTMQIIEQGHNANPFRFMAFGYSVCLLTALSEPWVSGTFSFLDSFLKALVPIVSVLVFYTVQYKILKHISYTTRTFDNYLTMSAIVGGISYLLYSATFIASIFNDIFGSILLIGISIYLAVYGLRTTKHFWNMSYGRIIWYSFLSVIACVIAIFAILIPVGLIFSGVLG
jgi:hypothetical protein